jgi:hypothetical protein
MDPEDEEALRLNALHRFRKHSSRLLLEEYSHCEVPAGCGGVVLRWIDPTEALPVLVELFAVGEHELFVDGVQLEAGRLELAPGAHLLALALDNPGPEDAPLLLSVVRALATDELSGPETVVLLCSEASSAWRWTSAPPPPRWAEPELDASSWQRPRRWTGRLEDLADASAWQLDRLRSRGAAPLAIPPGRAWLRVSFNLPTPSEHAR